MSGKLFQVGLFADSVTVSENMIYELKFRSLGQPAASYIDDNMDFSLAKYTTNQINHTGRLHIKNFDTLNQIVSGTFWFKGVNAVGDTVQVTDGRFDLHYTR